MTDLPPPQPPRRNRVTVADTYQEQRVTRPSHLDYGSLTVTLVSSDFTVADATGAAIEVERKFRAHAERWYLDTMPLSSYVEKILHPSYQKILVLGKRAVPLIMNELRDMPNDWFWALRMLTEVDPVARDQAGDMQAMANAWLSWWETEGSTWQAQNLS